MDYLDSSATGRALAAGTVDRQLWWRYTGVVIVATALRLDLSHPRIFFTLWDFCVWYVTSPGDRGVLGTLYDDPYNRFVLSVIGLKVAGFVVLHLGALAHMWRLNQRFDGKDFWFRYVSLSCPAGLLSLFLGMLLMPMVLGGKPDLTDPEVQRQATFMIMAFVAVVELFFFYRLRWSFRSLHADLARLARGESLDLKETDD